MPVGAVVILESFVASGPVAQLGARFHGMEEVVGSNPTRSTKSNKMGLYANSGGPCPEFPSS